jgi:hypothetical protein
MNMRAGWLEDLTNWLAGMLAALIQAIKQILLDIVTALLEAVLGLFATAIEAIGVPDWLSNNSIGGLLSNLPPGVLWFLDTMKIPEGLAIIGLGVVFRLVRKLLTLGQW